MEEARQHSAVAASALLLALAATPAAAGPQVWRGGSDGYERKLSFGPPDSDNLLLALSCSFGRGRVWVAAPLGQRETLSLSSGRVSRSYISDFHPETEVAGAYRRTSVPADDPVLAAFVRTGRISVGGLGQANASSDAERREIIGFMAACASRSGHRGKP